MKNYILTTLVFLLFIGNVNSAVFSVLNTDDSGTGSLREAIASADDDDIIDATGISGIITLTSEINITKNITINGPTSGDLAISGGGSSGIFNCNSTTGTVTINNLNFTAAIDYAIKNTEVIRVNNCNFYENSDGYCVYLTNSGGSSIINCTFTDNELGNFSCVYSDVSVEITSCTFENNSGTDRAVCLYANSGTIAGDRLIMRGNSGSQTACWSESGSFFISNSLFSGNNNNDGVFLGNTGSMTIINSTFSGNKVGIYNYNDMPLTLHNNILSGNTTYDLAINGASSNLTATYNIIGSATGHSITNDVDHNIVGVPVCFITAVPTTPSTGGDLHVFANSPAVNSGDNNQVSFDLFDVEDETRIQNITVDRGAYETNTAASPEINVKGNSISIVDNDATPDVNDHTDFGNVVNNTSLVRTYTISNTGTADLIIPTDGITKSGTHNSLYTIGGITLPATIPGSTSTTFTVTFLPTTTGLKTAAISIANNDCDENPYNFSIQGTGALGGIIVKGNGTSPASIADNDVTPSLTDSTDFGNRFVSTPLIRRYTIENAGASALTISSIVSSGPNASSFVVSGAPVSIGAASSKTFLVTFTPNSAGLKTATITINSNDASIPVYNYDVLGNGITTYTYTGTGNWTDQGNWSPVYPGLIIPAGFTVEVTSGSVIGINGLTIINNGTINNEGTFNVSGGTYTNNGIYEGNGEFLGGPFINPPLGIVSPGD